MWSKLTKLVLSTAVLFVAIAVLADDFEIDWYTVDSGGEMFTIGGDFELSGTIGQPDAGAVMTGGDFELTGGFWIGVEEFCFGDLDGDGTIGLADLTQLLAHYGMMSGASYEDGDLDGDGAVGLADLQALLAVYGTTCP
jgi:hypothetical protein